MGEAIRDQNHVPSLLGVSAADGVTPTKVKVNPVTGAMLAEMQGVVSGGSAESYVLLAAARSLLIGGSAAYMDGAYPFESVNLVDGATSSVRAVFRVPTAATAISSLAFSMYDEVAGNYNFDYTVRKISNGEAAEVDTVTGQVVASIYVAPNPLRNDITIPEEAYDGFTVEAGDLIAVTVQRNGAEATDTIGADASLICIRITFS